jgi:hypothetical protein
MKKRRKELPGHYYLLEIQKKRASEQMMKKRLVKELKKLSKEINQHRKNKDYEAAVKIANKLSQKMNDMDDETIKSISGSALRDVIIAIQAIHSASKEAVLIGLAAITFKNPFFR